jgi:hypothetical protein
VSRLLPPPHPPSRSPPVRRRQAGGEEEGSDDVLATAAAAATRKCGAMNTLNLLAGEIDRRWAMLADEDEGGGVVASAGARRFLGGSSRGRVRRPAPAVRNRGGRTKRDEGGKARRCLQEGRVPGPGLRRRRWRRCIVVAGRRGVRIGGRAASRGGDRRGRRRPPRGGRQAWDGGGVRRAGSPRPRRDCSTIVQV